MPKGSKTRRRRSYGKRGSKRLTLTKVNRKVNRLMHSIEPKFTSSALTALSITNTAFGFTAIDYPVLGTNQQQRVGDQITLKKLEFNFFLQNGGVAATMRLIIVMFKPNDNGNPADITDFLYFSASGAAAVVSPRNPDYNSTYKVLVDRIYNFKDFGSGSVDVHSARIKKKLSATVDFSTATDCTNQLYYCFVQDGSTAIVGDFISFVTYTDA